MRWVLIGLGLVLDLIGIIWFFQGINILPGSFMTGQPFWAVAGAITALVGIGLILLGLRRRPT
jgi:hypothetical protein